jgi:hypothetical protein
MQKIEMIMRTDVKNSTLCGTSEAPHVGSAIKLENSRGCQQPLAAKPNFCS